MQATAFIDHLHSENLNEIFSLLTTKKLVICSTVNKKWHEIIKNLLEIKRKCLYQKVFSPLDWNLHFKNNGITEEEAFQALYSLPLDIDEIPCPVDPTKKLIDTHIITYFPKGICLQFFSDLLKQKGYTINYCQHPHFENNYWYSWPSNFKTVAVEKFGWKALIKEILPDSLRKGREAQQEMVDALNLTDLKVYRRPSPLEAVISIAAELFKNKNALFNENYIRCLSRFSVALLEDFEVFNGYGNACSNEGVASIRHL